MIGTVVRRTVGVALALAALLGLRALSLWPFGRTPTAAEVRLSWTARPERIEQCRRLGEEELAALPAHMRLQTVCDGTFARYLLSVTIDDTPVDEDTIRGGGLRHDRPIHLLRAYEAAPGLRRLLVTLRRLDSGSVRETDPRDGKDDQRLDDRRQRESDERRRRTAEAIPATLALDTAVSLVRGRVVLITYDGEQRRLAIASRR